MIGLGAQSSLDTRSHHPQEQSLLKWDLCNQPVPMLLDPPSTQATGQAAGRARGAPGPCQLSRFAQDVQEPASRLKPKSGQKWKEKTG